LFIPPHRVTVEPMDDRSVGSGAPMHPIGVVAERTGLSAELVRVWERRYGVVEPSRDEGGRRLYSDADVERLRLLGQATSGGRNIGQVASLSTEELAELVRSDEEARWSVARSERVGGDAASVVEEAFDRVRRMDGDGLEKVLRRGAAVLGAWRFLGDVVAPLFQRVGTAWHGGELGVRHEHLASAVARPLLAQLRSALPPRAEAPLLLVATPAGEMHEIGALLSAGVAAAEGWRVVYLGPDLPAEEIAAAAKLKGARAVALSLVGVNGADVLRRELVALRKALPGDVPVLLGGSGASRLVPPPEGVSILESLEELRDFLGGR
jgi:MerR family transcriptional regulator, light-induced transcriptional regulator